jgi:D-inositol-3-phosphate glycosyltransferase
MYYGTINSILEKDLNEQIVGAWVAVTEFYKALLIHGSFTEYHFFISDNYFISAKENFKEMFSHIKNYEKVKIIRMSNLNKYIDKYEYIVFHHTDITAQIYYHFRDILFSKRIPISNFMHLASHPAIMSEFRSFLFLNSHAYDTIICPTYSAAKCVNKIFQLSIDKMKTKAAFNGKIEVIPFGVDTNKFIPRDKESVRNKYHIDKDIIIIGYIGRLASNNKMDIMPLIKIFYNILKKTGRNDIYLFIIGKEQEKNYVEYLLKYITMFQISDKIKIITEHNNSDIQYYYSLLDIFVSPCEHIQETFGITPIEAMSAGIPVVISDWDGYKETVTDNYDGFKIPTYWHKSSDYIDYSSENTDVEKKYMRLNQTVCVDVGKYEDALIKLIKDKNLREFIGRNARKTILEKYNWETIIQRLEKLWITNYEDFIERKIVEQKQEQKLFFNIFDHYPSSSISEMDTIVSTGFYKYCSIQPNRIFIHPLVKDMIVKKVISKIDMLCSEKIKIFDIIKLLNSKTVGEDIIYRHILWMLKHDYLKLLR